jgi:alkanesulfonate monooxygenase SsuD/methylene tetrahydromethanopterin reductase-like flavin-dependent oxidoreductase (luciferase family)
MYPVLAAVAATTRHVRIGSLVARVGFLPDRLVVESFVSLHELTEHRLVAALGIGDARSVAENDAYGIAWPALEERRASLASILGELTARGIECWVGATTPATLEIARAAGATVNLWDVELDRVEAEAARGPSTWAGSFPTEAGAAADQLMGLSAAGATWAIWGWPRSIDLVTEALRLAGKTEVSRG